MAIDAGIYGQIQQPQQQNPLNALAQAYQIRGFQSQMDKADRAEQQQNKLLQLVGSPEFSSLNAAQKAAKLQGVGAFDQASKLVESEAKVSRDAREAEKFQLEGGLKRMEIIGQVAGTVRDQASYEQGLSILQSQGIDTSKFNPIYDPAGVAQFANAAMSRKDQMEQVWKAKGYDLDVQKVAETNRHNETTEGLTAAGQAVTKRGQDLTDTRAREFNDTRVEENRLKREAQGTGVKMTEDQGKATGWLVQAENAYKNMLAAGFDKDGNPLPAAKPGVADLIANSPLGGPVGNWLRSPDRQKFVQGASSLSESLLRAATGAGVNKDEAKQKIEELTPIWGEDDATTKQKMAAIPLYIESLKVRAGPGASKAQEIRATAAPSSGGPIKVTNAADYANVPSGATYTTPDGKTRRKP